MLNVPWKTYLAILFTLVLTGCPTPPQPSLTIDDTRGDRLTCAGDFGERISLLQQNADEPQDITLEVSATTNGHVQPDISVTPVQVEALKNDTLQALMITGRLANKCQEGRVNISATAAAGFTTESDIYISPVPVIVTIEDLVAQNTTFSYTASFTCCPGSADTVDVAVSTGAHTTFPNVASVEPQGPTRLSLQCGANPTTEHLVINGTLTDATKPGKVRLILNDSVNKLGCIEDTSILP